MKLVRIWSLSPARIRLLPLGVNSLQGNNIFFLDVYLQDLVQCLLIVIAKKSLFEQMNEKVNE